MSVILSAGGIAALTAGAWIDLKVYAAQALIAGAWNRAMIGGRHARPWPWADMQPVAKLELASDGRSLVVLEGANGRNLAFGPVHDPASVLPGERGNSVVEGHRDTHFAALRHMRLGDRLGVERFGAPRAYFSVVDLRVVDGRRWRIDLNADAPRLMLVTCYPFDAVLPRGPWRLVVTAEAVNGPERARRSR